MRAWKQSLFTMIQSEVGWLSVGVFICVCVCVWLQYVPVAPILSPLSWCSSAEHSMVVALGYHKAHCPFPKHYFSHNNMKKHILFGAQESNKKLCWGLCWGPFFFFYLIVTFKTNTIYGRCVYLQQYIFTYSLGAITLWQKLKVTYVYELYI